MSDEYGGWGADFQPPDLFSDGDSGDTLTAGGWDEEFLPPDLAHLSPKAKAKKAQEYTDAYAAMADQIEQQRLAGPKPWDLPPNATVLETLNAKRLRELYGDIPENTKLAELEAAYANESDPAKKRDAFNAFDLERRRDQAHRERIMAEQADMGLRGISPEEKMMEERLAAEQDPVGRIINAPIMRGAITGVSNAASSIGETALRLAPSIGGEDPLSEMADVLGRSRNDEAQYQAFLDQQQGSAAALPNTVIQMTGEYAPLAAVGVPAPLQVGTKAANDAYLKSDDHVYAMTSAVTQAALTYAGGKLAGGTWIDMLGGKVASKTLAPMLKGFGIESAEEIGQLYSQAMIDRGFGVGDGRMPTLKDAAWTLAVTVGARGVGTLTSAGIEDDGVARPPLDERLAAKVDDKIKAFVEKKRPTRTDAERAGFDQVATSANERAELAADIKKRLTAEEFKGQVRAAATSPEEAEAMVDIFSARARAAGESLDDYVGRRLHSIQKMTRDEARTQRDGELPDARRGEFDPITMKDEGLAIIRAFESQRVNTLIHETAHLFRRDLRGKAAQAAANWAGAKDGTWDAKAEEKFARGFERYMATGRAPTDNVRLAFERYEKWMGEVYQTIEGSPIDIEISPEMRAVFDEMLTPPATTVAEAPAEPAPAEDAPGILAETRGLSATSIKNETVDAEREARGLPPMMAAERQSNPDSWDEAMRRLDANPGWAEQLQAELKNKPRAVDPVETSALLHRRVLLRNEYYDALEKWLDAKNAGKDDLAADLDARVAAASAALSDHEDVTKAVGTESGRSLQARKMMAEEDFSLAKMEMEKSQALGGPLTAEERAEIVELQKRIAELEQQLSSQQATKEAGDETKAVDSAMADAAKPARKPSGKGKAATPDPAASMTTAIASLQGKIDKGEVAEISPFVQKLAKLFYAQGITEREPMIDALHGVLEPMIPGWTREQTQRAFSGYGDFRPLSKDEISVGIRDLKGQTQQVLKLEALEARKPLEKTGVERREMSFEERRLQKLVNEAKRKYGVVVTDPASQLKSALEARKTYYRNRLVDMKAEIDAGQKNIKERSPSPSDAELESLVAEYRQLQEEYATIFGKPELTDAQRLKMAIAAAEKSEAAWQQRLADAKNGKFDAATGEKRKLTSPELEEIRARSEALKAEVELLKSLDSTINEQQQVASLTASLADVESKINSNDVALPSRKFGPESKAVSDLRSKLDAARDQLKAMREAKGVYDQRRLDSAKSAAQAAIDSLDARIKAGDLSVKKAGPSKTPLDDELRKLKFQRDYLNRVMADLRNAAKPKKSPEEIALKALKSRMLNDGAKLWRRLATDDFSEAVKKPGPALDEEGAKIKAELDILKSQYKAGLERDRWNKMNVWQKTGRHLIDAYDLGRMLMTTGELSFVLRQGKLATVSHPIMSAKALGAALRAMRNEATGRAIENQIFSHPKFDEARASRLHMTDEDSSLNKQEEFLVSRLAGKLPGVAAFSRAGRVFMNKLRFDMYLAMEKAATRTGTATEEERNAIATFINESTGRGTLGKAGEPAAVFLGRLLFSPRYLASRFQMLAGHSMWGGTARSRKLIAKEYGRIIVGMGAYYGLLAMLFSLGDDEKDGSIVVDPRSSDFGKVRVGDSRIDPMAGLSQVATLISRAMSGETTTISGKTIPLRGEKMKFGQRDMFRVLADFSRSKLHPMPATIINLLSSKDLSGQPVDVKSELGRAAMPITYKDIYDALREHGLAEGGALGLLAFFGEGLQNYGKN